MTPVCVSLLGQAVEELGKSQMYVHLSLVTLEAWVKSSLYVCLCWVTLEALG